MRSAFAFRISQLFLFLLGYSIITVGFFNFILLLEVSVLLQYLSSQVFISTPNEGSSCENQIDLTQVHNANLTKGNVQITVNLE